MARLLAKHLGHLDISTCTNALMMDSTTAATTDAYSKVVAGEDMENEAMSSSGMNKPLPAVPNETQSYEGYTIEVDTPADVEINDDFDDMDVDTPRASQYHLLHDLGLDYGHDHTSHTETTPGLLSPESSLVDFDQLGDDLVEIGSEHSDRIGDVDSSCNFFDYEKYEKDGGDLRPPFGRVYAGVST